MAEYGISLDANEALFSKQWPIGKHRFSMATVCQLEETTTLHERSHLDSTAITPNCSFVGEYANAAIFLQIRTNNAHMVPNTMGTECKFKRVFISLFDFNSRTNKNLKINLVYLPNPALAPKNTLKIEMKETAIKACNQQVFKNQSTHV